MMKVALKKASFSVLGVVAFAAALFFIFRPAVRSAPVKDPFFEGAAAELSAAGALPSLVIDLDRLDKSLDALKAQVKSPRSFRLIERAFPSDGLLRYALNRLGTRRVLVSDPARVPALLKVPGLGVLDLLMAAPVSDRSIRDMITSNSAVADQVVWVVDGPDHVGMVARLASELHRRLKVVARIDLDHPDEAVLKALFARLRKEQQWLEFRGWEGEEQPLLELSAPRDREVWVQQAAEVFARSAKLAQEALPASFQKGSGSRSYELLAHAGESSTWRLWSATSSIVNDIGVGESLILGEAGEEPAQWAAMKVVRPGESSPPGYSHMGWLIRKIWDRNLARWWEIDGGAHRGDSVWPAGVRSLAQELLSEKGGGLKRVAASDSVDLSASKTVFFVARGGREASEYIRVYGVRKGKIMETWAPGVEAASVTSAPMSP